VYDRFNRWRKDGTFDRVLRPPRVQKAGAGGRTGGIQGPSRAHKLQLES
jgi:hypothetical protein